MQNQSEMGEIVAAPGRRGLIKGAAVGSAVLAAGSAGLMPSRAAAAATATETDVFNFALNLEYLEAQYYLRAVTGQGLSTDLTGGTGTVVGGRAVPWENTAIAYFIERIAADEVAHVSFIRAVLGSAAITQPSIDFTNGFTRMAVAAGLIADGQTFDPFASEVNFLLGAYVFTDVGVTAYAGSAASLTSATLPYAASILATEGYHIGAIRARLAEIGGSAATNTISALRAKLSGVGDNGLDYQNNMFSFTNTDDQGQAFRRTPQQVLSIVYGGQTDRGLFFPDGVNGAITTAS